MGLYKTDPIALEALLRSGYGVNALDLLNDNAQGAQATASVSAGTTTEVIPPVPYVPVSTKAIILWSSYGVIGTGGTRVGLTLQSSTDGGFTWGFEQEAPAAGTLLDGVPGATVVGASNSIIVAGLVVGASILYRVVATPLAADYNCNSGEGNLIIIGLPSGNI